MVLSCLEHPLVASYEIYGMNRLGDIPYTRNENRAEFKQANETVQQAGHLMESG